MPRPCQAAAEARGKQDGGAVPGRAPAAVGSVTGEANRQQHGETEPDERVVPEPRLDQELPGDVLRNERVPGPAREVECQRQQPRGAGSNHEREADPAERKETSA